MTVLVDFLNLGGVSRILLTCVVEVDIVLCLSVASENDAGTRSHVCGSVVLR
jgi:hypothetical protein